MNGEAIFVSNTLSVQWTVTTINLCFRKKGQMKQYSKGNCEKTETRIVKMKKIKKGRNGTKNKEDCQAPVNLRM